MTSSNPHIVLVGLMGSGKSSVGRRLAQLTQRKFLDTDRLVEETHGSTVREMFLKFGEAEFRRRESAAVESALKSPEAAVIAAAGGVVLSEKNRALLTDASNAGRAVVVWLDTATDELVQRVKRGVHRPLLDEDPRGTLETMSIARRDLYAAVSSHVVVTTGKSIDDVASEVVRVLSSVAEVAHE